jgi:hypothetical protein
MKNGIVCVGLLLMIFLIPGCQYRKGTAFTWAETGDSVRYLIIDAGSGKHITARIAQLTEMHESKGDKCRIVYLSDSNAIKINKSILLFNSVLPDLKDDMLSKGFIGTFTTKQDITYLVVCQTDIEKYLTSSE